MSSPAYIIAKYLESLGVGTVGTDIFSGKEPETAGTIATLYDTGGRDPMHNLCADPDSNTWRPSVQLRVRADSYPTAFARISELRRSILSLTGYSITEVVSGVQTTDSVLDTIGRSDIISIGEDANNRPVLTANFDLLFSSHQFIVVDKSALQSTLAAAGALTEADYTPESWAALHAAVLAGQDVYDDTSANQVQVNEATAAITDAIASLVPAVQPDDCLGEWSTVIAQPPYSPLSLSGENNHIVETATDPAAGIYVASSNPLSPITIDWPVSEIRCFGARIQGWMTAESMGKKVSITLGLLNVDSGIDLGSITSLRNLDGSGPSVNLLHGRGIAQFVANSDDFMILGVQGNGRLVGWLGDWGGVVDTGYELDTGKAWTPVALIDNTSGILTGQGKLTLQTSAANLLPPPQNIPDIFTVKDFCGNVISSRSPDPEDQWPFAGLAPYKLEISGEDSQIVSLPAAYTPHLTYFAAALHDSISSRSGAADTVKGFQVKVLSWGAVSGYTQQGALNVGVGLNIIVIIGYDSNTDETTLSIGATDFALSGEVKDWFIGLDNNKTVFIIAGGQYIKTSKTVFAETFQHLTAYFTTNGTLVTLPSTQFITKASEMTITVPDMSADGISKVVDFAGNELA